MEYTVPADDRPHFVDWAAEHSERPNAIGWWFPTEMHHGGRDATVVIDNGGAMTVFHGRERVGTAAANYRPAAPGNDFWPLALDGGMDGSDLAELSHQVRDTGWIVCRIGDEYGLAQMPLGPNEDEAMWRLAWACVLLGFFPPLGMEFQGKAEEFKTGVATLGERDARRVKRALIERANHDRRELRELSDRIEATWRM